MDRNRSPDNVPIKPPYSADGTPGYYTDENGGTTVRAQELNQITEELRGLILLAGMTPDPLSDSQLRDALAGAYAVKASAGPISGGSSVLARAVVCGANCDIVNSGVILASQGSKIPSGGDGSVVAACNNSKSYGMLGGLFSSDGSINSGGLSALLASWNAELRTPYSIGGGCSPDPITKANQNQNLTWLIVSNGGHAHFAGSLAIGGDPNTGSGQTFRVDADGNVVMVGNLAMLTGHLLANAVSANGDLLVGGNASVTGDLTAAKGLTVPTGENKPAGIAITADIPPGQTYPAVLYNTLIGDDSFIFASISTATGGKPALGKITSSAGAATILVHNLHPSETATGVQVRWMIVNPA